MPTDVSQHRNANLLLILTDQQRQDSLGCYGGWAKTPVLDSLACRGIVFSNCYANAPVCAPSRIALASGRYPHNFGLWHNAGFDLPLTPPNWMRLVRDSGYRTALFGKSHLHKKTGNDLLQYEDFMRRLGYDDIEEVVGPRATITVRSRMTDTWSDAGVLDLYRNDIQDRLKNNPWMARPSPLPLQYYPDVYVADRAIAYLAGYKFQKPWCLTVGFPGPHEPWDCPEPFASMHEQVEIPPPKSLHYQPETLRESTLRKRLLTRPPLTGEAVSELRRNYAGSISLIDAKVGDLLRQLQVRGELDNTWIIFTSDHGEMNGDYGLLYKNAFFDEAIKVPLLVVPPAGFGSPLLGQISDEIIELFDVGATLVEAAGGDFAGNSFAKSLMPSINGSTTPHRDFAMAEFKGELLYADKRWKLAINANSEPYMLTDRLKPEFESNNALEAADASVVEDLRGKLFARFLRTQNLTPSQ